MLVRSVIVDFAKRAAMIDFIRWGLTQGQDLLEGLSYARLPQAEIAKEEKVMTGSGSAPHKRGSWKSVALAASTLDLARQKIRG
jgi:hypothetical protein